MTSVRRIIQARMSAGSAKPLHHAGKLRRYRGQRRGDHFTACNHDDVKCPRAVLRGSIGLGGSKDLANSPFGAIAHDSAAHTPRSDDAKPIAIQRIRKSEECEMTSAHAPPTILDERELSAGSQAKISAELLGHARPAAPHGGMLGTEGLGNNQPLAALGAAPFEHQPAILGRHAHQKTMGLAAATAVGLKRSLHVTPASGRETTMVVNQGKVCQRRFQTNIQSEWTRAVCRRPTAVVDSPAFRSACRLSEVFHTCGKDCGNWRVFPTR